MIAMNDNLILLEPELAEQIMRATSETGASPQEFVNQAARERLERLNQAKFEAETQAYAKLYPQLVKTHLGQFVAIHNGRVADHDKDFETLFLRTQKQLEGTPFLIQLVTESGEMTLRGPSPRLEWSSGV
jgi:hypothetical protein